MAHQTFPIKYAFQFLRIAPGRRSWLNSILLALWWLGLNASPASATIQVVDYWHIGEDDPNGAPGPTATTAVDSAGFDNLTFSQPSTYSLDLAATAVAHTGSSLSVTLANGAYAIGNLASVAQDNFGVEAWVKPSSVVDGQVIVYNGNTAYDGWGITVSGSQYLALFGGNVVFGAGVATPNVWAHVALVRNAGVATLYVNGVAAGSTTTATPYSPTGNFAIGAPPQSPTSQYFYGNVDEVRVFSFAAGQFSTSDLLWNAVHYSLGANSLVVGPAAGTNSIALATTPANAGWSATANASWLHLGSASQSGFGSGNVIFTIDTNAAATRTGTLTIAGQTLTITQAGSTFVSARPVAILAQGLNEPYGVAVDTQGNVYIADSANNRLLEWTVANNTLTTLLGAPLMYPNGLAVDRSGAIFIADEQNSLIRKLKPYEYLTSIVSSGVSSPNGLALDNAGNVFIADTGDNAIQEWSANDNTLTPVVSGVLHPYGVAVDGAGDVYYTDTGNNAIRKWTASSGVISTLLSTGLNYPAAVVVDGEGNLFIADSHNGMIKELRAADNSVKILFGGLVYPSGVAVDAGGDLYIANTVENDVLEVANAYVDLSGKTESALAGADTLAVLPASINLAPLFNPTSDQPWLTILGATNGVVGFSFTGDPGPARTAHITVLGESISVTQNGPVFTLGSSSRVEASAAGTDSVLLLANPGFGLWTATANDPWLHVNAGYQAGAGSTNFMFSFDVNPTVTRVGTLTIAGQTVTVTQAGPTYVPASSPIPFVSNGLAGPAGVAADAAGNIYIADSGHNALLKWTPASNTVTTLVSSGLSVPKGVAVDGVGNVYIADSGDNAVRERVAASQTVITLVNSGLSSPSSVAVDATGNVYIADANHNAIKEWVAASGTVTTLVSSGLSDPTGVAVDLLGNVYIADASNHVVKQWSAGTHAVTTAVSGGLNSPIGVAVDVAGNLYIADSSNSAVEKWRASDGSVTTLVSGLSIPAAVAVDLAGNAYITDTGNSVIRELPAALIDVSTQYLTANASDYLLSPVLPVSENLLAPFNPISDEPWLTIDNPTNGYPVITLAANPGSSRLGHINLLGQSISVVQAGPTFFLGTNSFLEGPAAGSEADLLVATPQNGAWTGTPNDAWLHLSLGNQSGIGTTNIVFTFDANPGATRSGSLTIGGQTLTVTQAGSKYVSARPANQELVFGRPNYTWGIASDGTGNFYLAVGGTNGTILKWNQPTNTLIALASGLDYPYGVAVDGQGNLYFSDTGNGAIKKWSVVSSNVTTLVPGLNSPTGVAVDQAGNVYFADNLATGAIQKWTAFNQTVTTLVSGLNNVNGVAVDTFGNVYYGDENTVSEWLAASGTVVPILSAGLEAPGALWIDSAGHVYIADTGHGLIKVWKADQTVTTISSAFVEPTGLAIDGAGDIYVADPFYDKIFELPFAFVDPSPRSEGLAAGSDSLPVILPTTVNQIAPTSDQPWLTINGVTNGVVNFSFSTAAAPRTGHITVLGESIAITQSVVATPPILMSLTLLSNRALQFSFTNNPGTSFTVLSSTDLSVALSNWTVVGAASNIAPGLFQFTTAPTTNDAQRFYVVRAP